MLLQLLCGGFVVLTQLEYYWGSQWQVEISLSSYFLYLCIHVEPM